MCIFRFSEPFFWWVYGLSSTAEGGLGPWLALKKCYDQIRRRWDFCVFLSFPSPPAAFKHFFCDCQGCGTLRSSHSGYFEDTFIDRFRCLIFQCLMRSNFVVFVDISTNFLSELPRILILIHDDLDSGGRRLWVHYIHKCCTSWKNHLTRQPIITFIIPL